MLNSDPDSQSSQVHSESLRRAEQRAIHTAVSGDTHIYQSQDELLKAHLSTPCFLHGLELVAVA